MVDWALGPGGGAEDLMDCPSYLEETSVVVKALKQYHELFLARLKKIPERAR